MIKSLIRTIPHYPRPGVMFRDITTLLKDPVGFRLTIGELKKRYAGRKILKIAGIESRGFVIGAALAYDLGAGFVPIRKRGKLPGQTIGTDYELEYGADRVEMHVDAVSRGEQILLVDDLVATGGTAEAAVRLVQEAGGEVTECCFVVELPELGGRKRLEGLGLSVFALVETTSSWAASGWRSRLITLFPFREIRRNHDVPTAALRRDATGRASPGDPRVPAWGARA
jgi:adenine phosphoribosyltransferase